MKQKRGQALLDFQNMPLRVATQDAILGLNLILLLKQGIKFIYKYLYSLSDRPGFHRNKGNKNILSEGKLHCQKARQTNRPIHHELGIWTLAFLLLRRQRKTYKTALGTAPFHTEPHWHVFVEQGAPTTISQHKNYHEPPRNPVDSIIS